MKKVFSIALALAMICGASAFAQNKDNKTCKGNSACTEQAGGNNKMYQPRTFTEFAFEGILLSPQQQSRIDSLNAAVNPNGEKPNCGKDQKCDKPCDKQKCDKKGDKKCDKQNCDKQNCKKQCADSAKCKKGEFKKDRPGMNRRGMRPQNCKAYASKVKEILTPEQYIIFLENISFNAPEQGMGQPRQFKGEKMKKCDKAPKCDKAVKCDKAAKKMEKKATKSK